jgi:hypothetical protein
MVYRMIGMRNVLLLYAISSPVYEWNLMEKKAEKGQRRHSETQGQ